MMRSIRQAMPILFLPAIAACYGDATEQPSEPAARGAGAIEVLTSQAAPRPLDGPYGPDNVLQTATLVEVHWVGPDRNKNADLGQRMPLFYADLAGSGYLRSLGEYGGAGQSVFFGGSYDVVDPVPSTVLHSDVENMLLAAIEAGELPYPFHDPRSALPLYVVHMPPGLSDITDETDNHRACEGGLHSWCAYHFFPESKGFVYAVIPDFQTIPACSLCGRGSSFPAINNTTELVSHEIVEALTDPWSTGVHITTYNPPKAVGNEIGDVCNPFPVAGGFGFTTLPAHNGPPWIVQSPYSLAQGTCVTDAPWSWDTEAYKTSGFVTMRGPFRMDAFSVTGRGGVVTSSFGAPPGASPHFWTQPAGTLGGSFSSAAHDARVAAIARVPGQMDIFVSGAQRGHPTPRNPGPPLWTDWWNQSVNNGDWNSFYRVVQGGHQPDPGAPLSAVSRDGEVMDVAFSDRYGNVVDYTFAAGQWGYRLLTIPGTGLIAPATPVSIISRFPDQLDAFAADVNGEIWTWSWNVNNPGAQWSAPTNLSGLTPVSPSTPIAAVARYPGHIDIFAAADDGSVQSLWYDDRDNGPDQPGSWNSIGAVMQPGTTEAGASVAVAIQGETHIDVFALTRRRLCPRPPAEPGCIAQARGEIATTWFDEHAAGSWLDHQYVIPGSQTGLTNLAAGLHAISRYRGNVEVFVLSSDGHVLRIEWQSPANAWGKLTNILHP